MKKEGLLGTASICTVTCIRFKTRASNDSAGKIISAIELYPGLVFSLV